MNQKIYSILFCALLASTFFHEIRAKASANPEFDRRKRGIETPITSIIELIPDTSLSVNATLKIKGNAELNLIAVVNLTAGANVALVLDIEASIVVLLNGNTGVVIIIDLKLNTVKYCGGWIAATTSIQVLLETGLTSFLTGLVGTVSDIDKVPESVLKDINYILCLLFDNIEVELAVNIKIGLELIIFVSIELVVLLNGVVDVYIELVGLQGITIKQDLGWFFNCLKGLGQLFYSYPGGLRQAFIDANATVDLQVFVNYKSGLEVFVNLVLALGVRVTILTSLNDLETFLIIVAKLGGLEDTGLNGLFKVLATIVWFINGKVTFEVVIQVLIQFLSCSRQTYNGDLSATLNQLLTALLAALKQAGATTALLGLVKNVRDLLNGTLSYGGVNLSVIITILLKGVTGAVPSPLGVIVEVLLLLKSIVKEKVALIRFLFLLIVNLNWFIGIRLLKGLGIVVDIVGSVVGSIIAFILKPVPRPKLYALILTRGFAGLEELPIIGDIARALSAAVTSVTSGKISLKRIVIIDDGFIFKNSFLGLFRLVGILIPNIKPRITREVNATLYNCTNVIPYVVGVQIK